ncbi:MAG: hypothetical protein ABIQ02_16435 [Saprospiraceae bacterium]
MEDQLDTNQEVLEKKGILSTSKFLFLSIITFGLYPIWWIYKSWCTFRDREDFKINPALRTIFSIFYLYGLFVRIRRLANKYVYDKTFSPILLFGMIIILEGLSYLPSPFFLISLLSIFCFTPPFEALNYSIISCQDYEVVEQQGYTTEQVIAIVLGSILWFLIITGLFLVEG